MGLITRLVLFIAGVLVSFAVYPLFTDLFVGGLVNIMSNLTSLILLLIVLMVMLAIPYVKMAGLGLLLGLFINYFYLTGVI